MRHRFPGFTLIETLIYTGFVGMILTSTILLVFATFTIRSKLRASVILEQNVRFAGLRIGSLVTEATGITTPSLGNTGNTLVLTTSVPATNPTTITNTGGVITVTQGLGAAQAITSNEVSFSTLSFARVSSTSAIVRMVMTASPSGSPASYSALTVTTTVSTSR